VQTVRIVDSHTAGEPTRVVLEGAPDLGAGSLSERLAVFRERFDWFRSAVVDEPRGSGVVVGALLCAPAAAGCIVGVLFFNNAGYLGMCGHGTSGVVATLAHLGRIGRGAHRLETSVGVVGAQLHGDGRITVENVAIYLHATGVAGHGRLSGDVAWGGNWFFLTDVAELSPARPAELTDFAWRIRGALQRDGVTGAGGAPIEHIELCAPSGAGGADSRNVVLCPGGAFDRSPCDTGTSARLACLAAEGRLAPGEVWVAESIIGSRFEATYVREGAYIRPSITGSAFITLDGRLCFDDRDPFRRGIPDA